MTQAIASIAEEVDRAIEVGRMLTDEFWTFLDDVYEAEVASEAAG